MKVWLKTVYILCPTWVGRATAKLCTYYTPATTSLFTNTNKRDCALAWYSIYGYTFKFGKAVTLQFWDSYGSHWCLYVVVCAHWAQVCYQSWRVVHVVLLSISCIKFCEVYLVLQTFVLVSWNQCFQLFMKKVPLFKCPLGQESPSACSWYHWCTRRLRLELSSVHLIRLWMSRY